METIGNIFLSPVLPSVFNFFVSDEFDVQQIELSGNGKTKSIRHRGNLRQKESSDKSVNQGEVNEAYTYGNSSDDECGGVSNLFDVQQSRNGKRLNPIQSSFSAWNRQRKIQSKLKKYFQFLHVFNPCVMLLLEDFLKQKFDNSTVIEGDLYDSVISIMKNAGVDDPVTFIWSVGTQLPDSQDLAHFKDRKDLLHFRTYLFNISNAIVTKKNAVTNAKWKLANNPQCKCKQECCCKYLNLT